MLIAFASTLLLLAQNSAEPPRERTTFRDHEHGYSCEVPEGWAVVSDAVVAEVFQSAGAGSSAALGFRAAFQPVENPAETLTYPYVLAQVNTYAKLGNEGPPQRGQMRAMLGELASLDVAEMVEAKANVEHLGGELGQAEFDESRFRFQYPLSLTLPDGQPVRGEAVGYFGRFAIVQLLFYAPPERWENLASARERFFQTFALGKEAALPSDYGAPSTWPTILAATIAGAVAGAAGMAYGAYRKRQSLARK